MNLRPTISRSFATRVLGTLLICVLQSWVAVGPVMAQDPNEAVKERGGMYGPAPSDRKNVAPPPSYTREIGIDQKLNAQLPLGLEFADDAGTTVTLGKFFDGTKPIILAPVYYECPSVCTLVLNGISKVAKVLSLVGGKDYQVVAFSFDPRETPELAARKKLAYMNELKDPKASEAWHFLTGSEANIRTLNEALGFRYFWDEKSETYAHAAAVIMVTPEGRVSRYLYGTNYTPLDVRLALTEAGQGRIGGFTEQVLMLCFQYDASMGRYSAAVLNLVRVGGAVVLLLMGAFIFLSVRREKSPAGKGSLAAQTARTTLFSPVLVPDVPQNRPDSGSEKV